MGEIVSLKLHRRRKDRAAKDEQAAENRARFGRTKHEKQLTAAEKEKSASDLDGHKRED
ncbi:DUF4169 family protein [Aestuariivirga sp.]|uniref:DUF4169 family protein n=1 Tax=Aestuariivirga sp. TaxID=2650926 RepID=UPI003593078A